MLVHRSWAVGRQAGVGDDQFDGILSRVGSRRREIFRGRRDTVQAAADSFASIAFQVSSMTDRAAAWISPGETIFRNPVRSATSAV